MEFDLENPLTDFHDLHSETFSSLLLLESDHMPSNAYLQSLQSTDSDVYIRQQSITLVSLCCRNFDPLLSYLAVNYLDRFLSFQGVPQPKPWILRLLAISCVSLAAKMRKTEFSLSDIQGDGGFIFDSRTVQRMEYLILGALQWRMRSVTPFSFISFFISFFKLDDLPLREALKARAIEIIFKAQKEISLVGFKPSVTGASALLLAAHELFPSQYPSFRKAVSNCPNVNKENLLECFDAMRDVVINGYESVFDAVETSETPVNVLDHHFSSSESENTIGTITVLANPTAEKDAKKRKAID